MPGEPTLILDRLGAEQRGNSGPAAKIAKITAIIVALTGLVTAIVHFRDSIPWLTPVATIEVTPSPINLDVGDRIQTVATAKDSKGNALGKKASWSSSNPGVAEVEVDGNVTAKGPGETTVVASIGVKPDVGHYGGAMPDSRNGTALRSWASNGTVIAGHGTSYAAPPVAKSLAALESRVTSPLSRELLIAMLIHGCEQPTPLREQVLSEVARQFTGFGMPKCSDEMLFTPDHSITLVFTDVLHAHRELRFDFAWPQSLVNKATGACTGDVRMTLVFRPVLNRDLGAEFVRVNVDAHLRQEKGNTFVNRVEQVFLPDDPEEASFEYELIRHGLKWWPIKVYRAQFPEVRASHRIGDFRSSRWFVLRRSFLPSACHLLWC